jgi:hypothetical protein
MHLNCARSRSHLQASNLLTSLFSVQRPSESGSGITLFGGATHTMHTNFTVTLDGGRAHPPVLHPLPVSESPYIYNVTLYDLQSVQMIPHLLTINLVPLVGFGRSVILFDSALINETVPATSTSSIPTSTSQSTSTAPPTQTSAGSSAGTTTKSRSVLVHTT